MAAVVTAQVAFRHKRLSALFASVAFFFRVTEHVLLQTGFIHKRLSAELAGERSLLAVEKLMPLQTLQVDELPPTLVTLQLAPAAVHEQHVLLQDAALGVRAAALGAVVADVLVVAAHMLFQVSGAEEGSLALTAGELLHCQVSGLMKPQTSFIHKSFPAGVTVDQVVFGVQLLVCGQGEPRAQRFPTLVAAVQWLCVSESMLFHSVYVGKPLVTNGTFLWPLLGAVDPALVTS